LRFFLRGGRYSRIFSHCGSVNCFQAMPFPLFLGVQTLQHGSYHKKYQPLSREVLG
jgi:hypothetical protein